MHMKHLESAGAYRMSFCEMSHIEAVVELFFVGTNSYFVCYFYIVATFKKTKKKNKNPAI